MNTKKFAYMKGTQSPLKDLPLRKQHTVLNTVHTLSLAPTHQGTHSLSSIISDPSCT